MPRGGGVRRRGFRAAVALAPCGIWPGCSTVYRPPSPVVRGEPPRRARCLEPANKTVPAARGADVCRMFSGFVDSV